EMMYSFWPTPMAAEMFPETAKGMNKSEKIVFSKTLKKAEWNNSRIVRSSPVDEVMKLKKQPGKNISVDSISIFQELMSHNLIDEYWFLVHPLLSPKGKRLFEGLEFSNQLELTDTRKFKSGVVALHYRNIES
ncbi:MAG: dihydrofolate reductase family protein, partial [Bacteroidetes bacterium]|nr:dihydrofolate reductase family protein [Bacteroidota bacterium]